jgi:hypothetical protein
VRGERERGCAKVRMSVRRRARTMHYLKEERSDHFVVVIKVVRLKLDRL